MTSTRERSSDTRPTTSPPRWWKCRREVTKTMLTDGAREALEGDRLIIEEGERSLNFQPHAPTTPIDGQIIAVADNAEQVGPYQVVVLNRGANAGLAQGAVLAVDQQGALVTDRKGGYPWKTKAFAKEVRLPYERAGIAHRVQGLRAHQLRPRDRRTGADARCGSGLQPVTHFSSFRRVRASHRAGPFVLGCRDECSHSNHASAAGHRGARAVVERGAARAKSTVSNGPARAISRSSG